MLLVEIVKSIPGNKVYLFIKRFFDFLFSFIALIVLSPVLLVIILLLSITGEGEVFYRQERVGYQNRMFNILKFATMLKNSPNIGNGDITVKDDSRVTPLGKFLRKSKINELPQLINILVGEMSFVGPRPLVKKGFEDYPEYVQIKIYNVKPGLTGAGSVIFRDEESYIAKSELPPREVYRHYIQPIKGDLELWYQQHRGFITDIMLLTLTFWTVIFPKSRVPYKIFPELPDPKAIATARA